MRCSRRLSMSVFSILSRTILLLGIGWAALEDLRTGKVRIILTAFLFASGLGLKLLEGHIKIWDLLLGSCIGLGLVLLSLLSRQAIGIGDGLMFMASGASLGLTDNLWLLLISLALSSAASIVLMVIFKYKGRNRIPFIPFMLTGYICLLMII
ncbi:MAG: hypothetical protein E7233_01835 [Lachnospiraceae bacterium]|nr:hypothetical protein [Lachnospiraceae bacterium]